MQFIPFGKIIEEYSIKAKKDTNYKVCSVTNISGFQLSSDTFDKQVFSEDLSVYKKVLKDSFAYNPSRINVGSIGRQNVDDCVLVSPLYNVFKINKDKVLPEFVELFIKSNYFKKFVLSNTQGSVRSNFKISLMKTMNFPDLSISNQGEILKKICLINKLIEENTVQLDYLDELIKSRFIEMFDTCEYNEYALGELSDISSGDSLTSPSIADIKSKENCYLVYGANGVRGYYSKANRHNKCILVGRVGAQAGNVHFYSGDFFATEHALVVEVNKKFVEPEWLSYVLAEKNLFSIAKTACSTA